MRRFLILLLTLALACGLIGANAEIPDLTGDWQLIYSKDGVDMLVLYVYLYEDQTMEAMFAQGLPGDSMKGVWSFDGETLILHVDDDLALTWDGENHRLTGEQEGVTVTMSLPIEPEGGDEPLAGGWTVSDDPAITPEIGQLLWTALDSYQTGPFTVSFTPVAYLGSQVVAGTNHAILCRSQEINRPAVWAVVYLYQDLEGSVSVLAIADLPLGV